VRLGRSAVVLSRSETYFCIPSDVAAETSALNG
jgi:hypothetical protein